jgi:hypothetical protein
MPAWGNSHFAPQSQFAISEEIPNAEEFSRLCLRPVVVQPERRQTRNCPIPTVFRSRRSSYKTRFSTFVEFGADLFALASESVATDGFSALPPLQLRLHGVPFL